MRRAAYIMAGLSAACWSCSPRVLPVRSERTDSVRVVREVQYREKVRDTTIFVAVPAESREAARRDSSHLETSVAASDAWIGADGVLSHTLRNKPATLQTVAQIRDTERTQRRDSIGSRVEWIEVPVKLPLTRWERFWIAWGRIAAGVLAAAAFTWIVRKRLRG